MHNADVECRSCRVKQANCPNRNGKRCCAECWHPQVMRAKPRSSPPIIGLPSPELTDAEEERIERVHRAAKAEKRFARLTPGEREVIRLQAEGVPQECTREIPVEELQEAMDRGWELVAQVNGVAIVKNQSRLPHGTESRARCRVAGRTQRSRRSISFSLAAKAVRSKSAMPST
jgi:hypothetical protein